MNTAQHTTRLETLLRNLPGMAYRCLNEPHWPMDFVSDGCLALCGYRREEIESQSVLWGDFTHPEDLDEVDRRVRAATARGESFEVEYRIVARGGRVRWVWERGRVVRVREDGVAVLEGFITDITSRKESETALRRAEAHAQAVLESAADAIITIDGDGRIESFNRAATRTFGYTAACATGRRFRELVVAGDREAFDARLPSVRVEGTTDGEDADASADGDGNSWLRDNADIDCLTSDGRLFPASLSVNPVDSRDGTDDGRRFVILVHDLTRWRARDRQIREQRELLAHADRLNTLGEMAAAIAHEINQPLTAISAHAQSGLRFLRRSPPAAARVEEGLELIGAQARRAGAVIERVQMMARREERRPEVVDVATLLHGIPGLAELDARTRRFVIELDLPDGLPPVSCDPVQIQQVILNLLRNGMESMSAAGCAADSRIRLQAERVTEGVRIRVADRGTGLSDQVNGHLFEPFSSSKPLGMGLGLAISRSIVTAHGGTLDYADDPEGGATFGFVLAPAGRD